MVTRSEPDYAWDFCGGHLAVDFTNTVGDRGATPHEHFNTYGDVLSWADTRGVLTAAETRRLRSAAERRPTEAHEAVVEIRALRESLYRILTAAGAGRTPPGADLARLNTHVEVAFARARLARRRGRLALAFADAGARSLSAPVTTPVVRAAIELLTSDQAARIRICADRACAWLFVDGTRSRTRRWCDMTVCGNRNKVRRFRASP
jgi:predicted RNA-binding Zn ribbon-like protein